MREQVNTAWAAIRCPPLSRLNWLKAAKARGLTFSEWARSVLDAAAEK